MCLIWHIRQAQTQKLSSYNIYIINFAFYFNSITFVSEWIFFCPMMECFAINFDFIWSIDNLKRHFEKALKVILHTFEHTIYMCMKMLVKRNQMYKNYVTKKNRIANINHCVYSRIMRACNMREFNFLQIKTKHCLINFQSRLMMSITTIRQPKPEITKLKREITLFIA